MTRGLAKLFVAGFVPAAVLCAGPTAHSAPPAHVVSLAPNLTDMVRHIGAEESLAAVTPFCQAPEEVPRVPGGMQPDAEAVLALSPDLVLASSITPSPTLRQLRDLGIRTEVFETGSLGQIHEATKRLAAIFGKQNKDARAPSPRLATQSAVLLFGADTGFSAGCGTHAHEILEAAGLRNIAANASGPWPQLGEEFLLASDPDIIVVADYGNAQKESILGIMRRHSVRKHLQAVRAGRIVVFPAAAFSIPGPDALEAGQKLRAEVDKL